MLGRDPHQPVRRRGPGDDGHLDVVLEGFGHGQLTAPCVDRIMAQFLAQARVESLDVSCVRDAHPLAFFTSMTGPPP